MPLETDLFDPAQNSAQMIQRVVDAARERGVLEDALAEELIELFGTAPDGRNSSLSVAEADQFVAATEQLIEVCLLGKPAPRQPLMNALLQSALDVECLKHGDDRWLLTREICDEARRGTDRRFTFGQIKEKPADPTAPSMFGGLWEVDCGGLLRKVLFTLTAESIAGSCTATPVPPSAPEYGRLLERLQRRGPHHWQLQVEPTSPLGQWIEGLTGTSNIGQHFDHVPLGVLCEATQRELTRHGLSHMLLGPSRRDPPSRPWHAGAFLRRVGELFDFEWCGHAMQSIDGEDLVLVEAKCRVRLQAQLRML